VALLGVDFIALSDADAMRRLLASGTVGRMGTPPGAGGGATAAPDATDHLPRWARRFFPLTRGHPPGGWFLGLTPADAPTYAPRRAFLDAKFASRGDVGADVAAAADALLSSAEAAAGSPPGPAERVALEAAFVNAVGRRFTGGHPTPAPVVAAATRNATSPTDILKPWVVMRARRALAIVAEYARAAVAADDAAAHVRPVIANDVAHGVLSNPSGDPGVKLLRLMHAEAVAGRWGAAGRPMGELFARLAVVSSVPRLVMVDGDLGGLLPPGEPPARAGVTLVQLGIGAAAQATGDASWAWSTGSGGRQCAARGALEAFAASVRDEVGSRLAAAGAGGGGGSAADKGGDAAPTGAAKPRVDAAEEGGDAEGNTTEGGGAAK